MAEVRPFRALRYDPAIVDPARAIAPPYDVISAELQAALYERDPHNVIRIEYGRELPGDGESSNKYTRAAADLREWRRSGALALDAEPALYRYRQRFEWDSRQYEREAWFGAVRLTPWDEGSVRPHEHTLATPKADRMHLLRATRTQVSPVYALYRPKGAVATTPGAPGEAVISCEADGQHHRIERIIDGTALQRFTRLIDNSDVYIADGHHRYETALAFRDDARGRASSWSGDEPENFVLMALTAHDDPGLLVLPTHRVLHLERVPPGAVERLRAMFDATPIDADGHDATERLVAAGAAQPSFVVAGLPGGPLLLTLRDRAAVEALMPGDQPHAWKRLDVNVLQYGILQPIFGIDDATLSSGAAVTYTQDARAALGAIGAGRATAAFLLNATPVSQVLDVADAGARMPQKSTYFQPKLPTGLVMRPLE